MASYGVDWEQDPDAVKRLQEMLAERVEKIAFQVEGQAKRNIQSNGQIDTGFMLNSVYAVTPRSSSYGQTRKSDDYENRGGTMVRRRIAPEAAMRKGSGFGADALVAAGAEYAIFQEVRQSFLFRALEQVRGRLR